MSGVQRSSGAPVQDLFTVAGTDASLTFDEALAELAPYGQLAWRKLIKEKHISQLYKIVRAIIQAKPRSVTESNAAGESLERHDLVLILSQAASPPLQSDDPHLSINGGSWPKEVLMKSTQSLSNPDNQSPSPSITHTDVPGMLHERYVQPAREQSCAAAETELDSVPSTPPESADPSQAWGWFCYACKHKKKSQGKGSTSWRRHMKHHELWYVCVYCVGRPSNFSLYLNCNCERNMSDIYHLEIHFEQVAAFLRDESLKKHLMRMHRLQPDQAEAKSTDPACLLKVTRKFQACGFCDKKVFVEDMKGYIKHVEHEHWNKDDDIEPFYSQDRVLRKLIAADQAMIDAWHAMAPHLRNMRLEDYTWRRMNTRQLQFELEVRHLPPNAIARMASVIAEPMDSIAHPRVTGNNLQALTISQPRQAGNIMESGNLQMTECDYVHTSSRLLGETNNETSRSIYGPETFVGNSLPCSAPNGDQPAPYDPWASLSPGNVTISDFSTSPSMMLARDGTMDPRHLQQPVPKPNMTSADVYDRQLESNLQASIDSDPPRSVSPRIASSVTSQQKRTKPDSSPEKAAGGVKSGAALRSSKLTHRSKRGRNKSPTDP